MEVACGEYGDNVPKLVVSVKAGKCEQFQNLRWMKKNTNCDKVCAILYIDIVQEFVIVLYICTGYECTGSNVVEVPDGPIGCLCKCCFIHPFLLALSE